MKTAITVVFLIIFMAQQIKPVDIMSSVFDMAYDVQVSQVEG